MCGTVFNTLCSRLFVDLTYISSNIRTSQVVEACTAIIDHSSCDTTEVLVQRSIAYTLMDGFNQLAVSDCLKAFARDKEKTIQVGTRLYTDFRTTETAGYTL